MRLGLGLGLRLTLTAALLSLALIAMVVPYQLALSRGQPVLLKVVPVDPRSLFAGDYVILTYPIQTIAEAALPAVGALEAGATVYVALQRDDTDWRPVAIEAAPAPPTPERITLRAEVAGPALASRERRFDYGIHSFYVPEGRGLEIEAAIGQGAVQAEVMVDDSGRGVLRALLVDGERRFDDRLFR